MWSRRGPAEEPRDYHEKLWRQAGQPAWEEKWRGLSVRSRQVFVEEMPLPDRRGNPPRAPSSRFNPVVLQELTTAGLVVVREARQPKPVSNVEIPAAALDFARRLKALRRYRLLTENEPGALQRFVTNCFRSDGLWDLFYEILGQASVEPTGGVAEVVRDFVAGRRWPGWALDSLKLPLAGEVFRVVEAAGGPVPLADLPALLQGREAGEVRAVVDDLTARLVLFEDLHPQTYDLLLGVLPAVREDAARATLPRQRPPLEPTVPVEVGPEGGFEVNDLRAVLLELAAGPARLRQDGALFQKEFERFRAVLEPLPDWLTSAVAVADDGRVDEVFHRGHRLRLLQQQQVHGVPHVALTSLGRGWLAADLSAQYATLFEQARSDDPRQHSWDFDFSDHHYLGASVVVLERSKRGRPPSPYNQKPEDRQRLRDALYAAWRELAAGEFYRLDAFAAHAAFGPHNPLHLGLPADRVAVYWKGRPVPALEEQREEAARHCLRDMALARLLPLGCLQAGVDADGELGVARTPRLDVYFGMESAAPAGALAPEARVIVQPDFTVVIIGLNPAPGAELAPFCERAPGRPATGTLQLKITRDAVVRAVAHGLKPDEIAARLERHATTAVPANVLHEVRAWAGWVREVTYATWTVFRCPDRDTADRLKSALGRDAERLGETLVGVPAAPLKAAERNKLRQHGLLATPATDQPGKKKKKPAR